MERLRRSRRAFLPVPRSVTLRPPCVRTWHALLAMLLARPHPPSQAPCVGLSFADESAVVHARQAQATRALRELLARDATRACVVAWSVCNEPGGPKSVPTAQAKADQTAALIELVQIARTEGSRPVTFANIPEHCDEANRACDFLSLNEYAGMSMSARPRCAALQECQMPAMPWRPADSMPLHSSVSSAAFTAMSWRPADAMPLAETSAAARVASISPHHQAGTMM